MDIERFNEAPARDEVEIETGYWECAVADRHFEVGQLALVIGLDEHGRVRLTRRDHTYAYEPGEFLAAFRPAPEGEARVDEEMAALMADVNALGAELRDMRGVLERARPSVSRVTGEVGDLEEVSTALVPAANEQAKGARAMVLRVKEAVAASQAQLAEKQKALQAILREKMALAEAQVAPLKAMVKRLEEAVWTIDLYLGKEEEIHLLVDGEPAPVDEPVAIRQMVLAMDEECAVAAETGGIDALGIEQFDEWLRASWAHVEQVMPEPKGVVALVPRWHGKRYEDPWKQQAVDEMNRKTYFLIRNGSKVYRVYTDFFAGRRLVPTSEEFTGFFFDDERDWDTGGTRRVPLEPGSAKYLEAEKRADAQRRHYMRVALILQGLIDRTAVLRPLPGPVTVTDPAAYEAGLVRIVADAERVLGEGVEPFRDWFARVNADMEPGRRIVGAFGGYGGAFYDLRSERRGHERLSPPTADYPKSLVPHRLEGRRGDGFFFRYDRGEVWSRDEGYRQAKTRASCVVEPGDKFVLLIDHPDVTVEAIRRYLASRTERPNYADVFPILTTALQVKLAEAEAERPFRELLAHQVAVKFDLSLPDAESLVPQAVEAYKFKYKNHRALLEGEEGRVYEEVLAEAGFLVYERENRARRRERGEFQNVLEAALNAWPDAFFIGHRRDNEYLVLAPMNAGDVWTRVVTVKTSPGMARIAENAEWRIANSAWRRCEPIHTTARLETWQFNANPWEHLTDPEVERLGGEVAAWLEATRERQHNGGWRARSEPFVPLEVVAVTWDDEKRRFTVWSKFERHGGEPGVQRWKVGFTRDASREPVLEFKHAHNTAGWGDMPGRPWERFVWKGFRGGHERVPGGERVLFEDPALEAQLDEAAEAYRARQAEASRVSSRVHGLMQGLRARWLRSFWDEAFAKFVRDYGDASLWEGHRKSIKVPDGPLAGRGGERVDSLVRALVERGAPLSGVRLGEAWALAGLEKPAGLEELDELELEAQA